MEVTYAIRSILASVLRWLAGKVEPVEQVKWGGTD
jgi:hypothetical protein